MITLKATVHPLECAYYAAKRLPFTDIQIDCLRKIAARYATSEPSIATETALALLEEARLLQRRLMVGPDYHASLVYPSFAVDLHRLGLQEQAKWIVRESAQVAQKFKPKFEASMLIMTADACHGIGENARCRELLDQVERYLRGRKRPLSQEDWTFDVLHALYLKLGDVDAARELIPKLQGVLKVDALVATVFHRKPFWKFEGDDLHHALMYCERFGYEYPLTKIAKGMGEEGLFFRARSILGRVQNRKLHLEGTLDIAISLLQDEKVAEALEMLEPLWSVPTSVFEGNLDRAKSLVALLLPSHGDFVWNLLRRVREELELDMSEGDRLLKYTRFIGLVAAYSKSEADELVDVILGAPLADLDRARTGAILFSRSAPRILFEVAMAVEEHSLRWNEERRTVFRGHLEAVPVPRIRVVADALRAARDAA